MLHVFLQNFFNGILSIYFLIISLVISPRIPLNFVFNLIAIVIIIPSSFPSEALPKILMMPLEIPPRILKLLQWLLQELLQGFFRNSYMNYPENFFKNLFRKPWYHCVNKVALQPTEFCPNFSVLQHSVICTLGTTRDSCICGTHHFHISHRVLSTPLPLTSTPCDQRFLLS